MQTFVPHRNAIKHPVHPVRRFIILSAVMVLPVSLSQHQNGRNCDGRDGELGTLHENEREDKSVNVATTP